MFKNFKLSECDNFLYGAFIFATAAVLVGLFLVAKGVVAGSDFAQGCLWVLTGIAVVCTLLFGHDWVDETGDVSYDMIKDDEVLNNDPVYVAERKTIVRHYHSLISYSWLVGIVLGVAILVGWFLGTASA